MPCCVPRWSHDSLHCWNSQKRTQPRNTEPAFSSTWTLPPTDSYLAWPLSSFMSLPRFHLPEKTLLNTVSWIKPHHPLYPHTPQFASVQFSCSVVSESLWPHGLQHASPPCPSSTPRACSNSCPSSSDAIQPSYPRSPLPTAFNLSQHQGLFQGVSSSHLVAKVLELQL